MSRIGLIPCVVPGRSNLNPIRSSMTLYIPASSRRSQANNDSSGFPKNAHAKKISMSPRRRKELDRLLAAWPLGSNRPSFSNLSIVCHSSSSSSSSSPAESVVSVSSVQDVSLFLFTILTSPQTQNQSPKKFSTRGITSVPSRLQCSSIRSMMRNNSFVRVVP